MMKVRAPTTAEEAADDQPYEVRPPPRDRSGRGRPPWRAERRGEFRLATCVGAMRPPPLP